MRNEKSSHRYDDIINLPHPTSEKHPRMSLYDRAAQFSPFAALTGHDAAIKETARLTDERWEIAEDTKEQLNETLQWIAENIDKDITVTFTYFVPDLRKSGGAYVTATGSVKKIDEYGHKILLKDGTEIPMEQIKEIEPEQPFHNLY